MFSSLQPYRKNHRSLVSTLLCGVFVFGLALSAQAGMGAGGGAGGAGTGGAAAGGTSGGTGAAGGGAGPYRALNQSDSTTCVPGQVWDAKTRKCLQRHSGVLLDPELTEYAFGLAKADCYREAIDVLDTLENPNTPRALN
jgi:hypothetical protein